MQDLTLALNKLSSNDQQLLWTSFVKNRASNGDDKDYTSLTRGTGARDRSRQLLLAWLKGGGYTKSEHYLEAKSCMTATQSHTVAEQ